MLSSMTMTAVSVNADAKTEADPPAYKLTGAKDASRNAPHGRRKGEKDRGTKVDRRASEHRHDHPFDQPSVHQPRLLFPIPDEVARVLAKARESGPYMTQSKRLLEKAWLAWQEGRTPSDSELADDAGCSEGRAMEWADDYALAGLWPMSRDGIDDEPDEDDPKAVAEIEGRLRTAELDQLRRADLKPWREPKLARLRGVSAAVME